MRYLLAILGLLLSCVAPCMAQKANIGFVYPCSACRGSEIVLEIGGQGINGAQSVLISGDGIVSEILPDEPEPTNKKGKKKKKGKKIITDEDNLQLEARVKVRVKLAKDAELGMRDIKLVAANGAISNRLYFEVVSYPIFCETEDNGTLATANDVGAIPVVLNGQVERGGRDSFRFEAKAGQKIVAEVLARRFVPFLADAVPGWFQAVLSLYDESGREVAFSDDYNLNPDPVIRYTIPKDGKYTLQIQDSIFRGREDFVYRIAVGELPFVHSVFPLGGAAGSSVNLELVGDNLKSETVKKKLPAEKGRTETRVAGVNGDLSNPFVMDVSDKNEIVLNSDSGDTREHVVEFTQADVINARIDHDRDQDWYSFRMKDAEQLLIEITARRLCSPLDARIQLYDEEGKMLAECDDTEDVNEGMITHHADPQMSFTAPRAGKYYLRVTDTQNKYGRDYAYRLSMKPSSPSFSLRVEPSALSIPQGGTTQFTVFATREHGFEGAIDLAIKGLPEGFVLSDMSIRAKQTSQKITITAPMDVAVGKLNPTIEGTGINKIKGMNMRQSAAVSAPLIRIAEPVEAMLQAFYITHLLPTQEFRMDIVPAQEFRIEVPANDKPIQLIGGQAVKCKVIVHRQKGFDEPIQLLLKGLPKTIKSNSPVNLAAGETVGEFILTCETWNKSSMPMRPTVTGVVAASGVRKGKMANKLTGSVMVNSPMFTILTPKEKSNAAAKVKKKKNK